MQHCDAFDYWGSGTEVTVSSGTAASPTLFPLVKCDPDDAGQITVGCLASDFYPKSLTFQWTDASGTTLTSAQYPPTEKNNKYTGVSLLKVSNSDWNSRKSFSCSVTHQGGKKSVKLEKKASSSTNVAPYVTMTLKPSKAKDIFINKQVKFECTITGQDQSTLNKIQITWKMNGQTVTRNISETNSGGKTSTLTLSLSEWQSCNNVHCSANSDNMTPVTQDLTIHKGDGIEPKVTVHILPEEDISKGDSAEVTMVCLVSSSVQQDYYIAWLEESGQSVSNYTDGINFLPQKTERGFSAISIYSTTQEKWNNDSMFSCNVWAAGRKTSMKSRNVSKAKSNAKESLNLYLAMSCTDDATEEDEYSSLWSTTSSFIFLFISSLLYSMIFSLVKMKKP